MKNSITIQILNLKLIRIDFILYDYLELKKNCEILLLLVLKFNFFFLLTFVF